MKPPALSPRPSMPRSPARWSAIGNFPHILGSDMPAVVIESDGKDEWVAGLKETPDYDAAEPR